MRKPHLVERCAVILSFLFVGLVTSAKPKEVIYELTCSAQPNIRFNDISKGLILKTTCEVENNDIYDLSQLPEKAKKDVLKKVKFGFQPDASVFFEESFKKYVTSAGFFIGHEINKDYTLRANLKELKVTDGVGTAPCTAVIEWSLMSPDRRILLEGIAKGRHILSAGQLIPDILDKAYGKALADIDWHGIAAYLSNGDEVNKRADQEKDKQVSGEGDTALEHTVIRWYILSSPAGADVSWRVVSSTPDVKNTNSNYVGTTPYETTESFDLKGLKYNNSGNVQIEVTCEKPGYLPQRKRFNLRQAIDQKEISTKFNLVKDVEN